jgi:hypothetical protein
MATNKEKAVFVGSTIAAFLLGWLLHHCKKVPGGITLSDLVISPQYPYYGDTVEISVVALNEGAVPLDVEMVAHVGNEVLTTPATLLPGVPQTIHWSYEITSNLGYGSYNTTVSVGPLQGTFRILNPS